MDDNQVVCNCFNVTVKDIKNAIESGAKTYEEVQEITSVGTGCGGCADTSEDLVNSLL